MAKNFSIKSEIEGMKVGEEKRFEPQYYRSVTVTCSDLGFVMKRKYSVRRDREKYQVIVTREM